MARQRINTGTSPNDGLGDSLLAGAIKINSNFSEIYNTFGNGTTLVSYANTAGIATYAQTAGISTSAGTATTATNLSNAANILTGTINKDRISTTNALTVLGDLYVSNNISFGGTTTQLNTQQLQIVDADIILGIGTTFNSTDNTANHGGIAIASTEGTPLVNLNIVPEETNPSTYKKIMWFRGSAIGAGLTDAWLFNYAVGIGSTQVPNGVRLAAGGMQVTDTTISTPQLNVSGVSTFQGNINLGDNDFAYFGDAGDLYIGHNGSVSAIADAGTGDLYIAGDNSLIITDLSYAENKAKFNTNGSVELYYDNVKKFETLGTGVTVTGTTFTNQLNVSGVVTATSFSGSGANLTGIIAGVGIQTSAGLVGTGATILDFRGSGISTITVASGIATINITGGGGGGSTAAIGDLLYTSGSPSGYIQPGVYSKSQYPTLAAGVGTFPDFNNGNYDLSFNPTQNHSVLSGSGYVNVVNSFIGQVAVGTDRFLIKIGNPYRNSTTLVTSTDGINYSSVTVDSVHDPTGGGVAYGNGVWIAANNRNQILRSTNGTSFQQVSISPAVFPQTTVTTFRLLTYQGNKFFLVYSTSNTPQAFITLYSLDGITWNRTYHKNGLIGVSGTPANTGLQILYDAGTQKYYHLISSTQPLYTSTDGITWTNVSNPSITFNVVKISIQNGWMFLYYSSSATQKIQLTTGWETSGAVSNLYSNFQPIGGSTGTEIIYKDGAYYFMTTAGMYRSTDNMVNFNLYSWNNSRIARSIWEMIYNPNLPGKIVLFGRDGNYLYSGDDGVTWVERNYHIWQGQISGSSSVIYFGNLAIIRGSSSGAVVIDMTTGEFSMHGGFTLSGNLAFFTYTVRSDPPKALAVNGNQVLGVKSQDNCLKCENITLAGAGYNDWSMVNMQGSGNRNIVYNSNIGAYFAGGSSASTVGVSTNGTDWTISTKTTDTGAYIPFGNANGYTFFHSTGNQKFAWTNDLVNWYVSFTISVGSATAVAYNGTNYVIVSTNNIRYSNSLSNNSTWTSATGLNAVNLAVQWNDVIWVPGLNGTGLFVACSSTGLIVTSPDGISWTRRSPATNFTIGVWQFAWDNVNNVLFAITDLSILSSTNGVDWIMCYPWASNSTGSKLRSIASRNGITVVSGSASKMIFRSTDGGQTWEGYDSCPGSYFVQIVTNATGFVGMSDVDISFSTDGILWTSPSLLQLAGSPVLSTIHKVVNTNTLLALSWGTNGSGGGIYRSTDGQTWTLIRTPGIKSNVSSTPNSLVISSSNTASGTRILAKPSGTGFIESLDDGLTWTEFIPKLSYSVFNFSGLWSQFQTLLNKPNTNTWIGYFYSTGWMVSEDNCRTWGLTQPQGAGNFIPINSPGVATTIGFYVIFIERSGVYFSENGKNWSLLSLCPMQTGGAGGSNLNIYAKPDGSIFLINGPRGLFYSTDNCQTWKLCTINFPDSGKQPPNAVSSLNYIYWDEENSVFISENPYYFVASKDGKNWYAIHHKNSIASTGSSGFTNTGNSFVVKDGNVISSNVARSGGASNPLLGNNLLLKIPLYSYNTSTHFYLPPNGLTDQTSPWIKS